MPGQVHPAGCDADDAAGQGVVGQGVHAHLDRLAGQDPGGVGLLEGHDDLERVGGVQRHERAGPGRAAAARGGPGAAGRRGQRRGAAGGEGGDRRRRGDDLACGAVDRGDGGRRGSRDHRLVDVALRDDDRRACVRTWARCAAMSCGRSLPAVASWFWAVTTACWAFWTETSPDARSVRSFLLGGVERGLRRDHGALGLLDGRTVGEQAAARGAGVVVGERDVVVDVAVQRGGGGAQDHRRGHDPGRCRAPERAAGRPTAPHGITRRGRGRSRRHDGDRIGRPGG